MVQLLEVAISSSGKRKCVRDETPTASRGGVVFNRPSSEGLGGTISGQGPRAALCSSGLAEMGEESKKQWLEHARVDAILGACPRSLASVRSGILCYESFLGLFTKLALIKTVQTCIVL